MIYVQGIEAAPNGVVCRSAILVGFCSEWNLQDFVAVKIKHNHNILVSTAGFDMKATCIIRVKL